MNQAPKSEFSYFRMLCRRLMAYGLYLSGEACSEKSPNQRNWQILKYQRIVKPEENIFPLELTAYTTPKTFRTHLKYLSEECNVISLADLLQKLERGLEFQKNTVVLTFDGGWIDFYKTAFPMLGEFNLPATVFLPTAYIETNNLFLNDKIISCLILLKNAGLPFPALPGIDNRFPELEEIISNQQEITGENINLLISIIPGMNINEKALIIIGLEQLIDSVYEELPQFTNFTNWSELREMSAQKITFASFGHVQRRIMELNAEELKDDLKKSFETIIANDLEALHVYSPPYGLFDKESLDILDKMGLNYLATSANIRNFAYNSDRLNLLPRIEMFETVSFCKEIFACRLWNAKLFREYF
jgi:peptidoglycan/xylan/chitin deacetylase (PgdA/CDA1 family)